MALATRPGRLAPWVFRVVAVIVVPGTTVVVKSVIVSGGEVGALGLSLQIWRRCLAGRLGMVVMEAVSLGRLEIGSRPESKGIGRRDEVAVSRISSSEGQGREGGG